MEQEMKKLFVAISCVLLLSGCWCTSPTKIVEIEVYKTPEFKMPTRPVLSSKGGTPNEVAKNAEKDMIDLKGYSIQLENVLIDLKSNKQ